MELQRNEIWQQARIGKITCSNFYKVMTRGRAKDCEFGDTAITYAMEIVTEILTGEKKEDFTNAAMEWGNTYEREAKEQYQLETFNKIINTEYIPFDDIVGGSPDGLVGDDGIIEIKCPNSTTHLTNLINKEVPAIYKPQVHGYLMITGRKWCDFVSYDPRFKDEQRLLIVRIERDEQYISELKKRIEKFKIIINEILKKINL
jgi:putative phage-type endonuclease